MFRRHAGTLYKPGRTSRAVITVPGGHANWSAQLISSTAEIGSIFLLYNSLLALGSPLLALLLLNRLRKGKSREGWAERWGRINPLTGARPRIWFHAASVGEVSAALPIVLALRQRLGECAIALTAVTPGGYETAAAQRGKLLDGVYYAPFDAPWAVRRALNAIRPDLLVVMETELWPNLLHLAKAGGAKLVLANGRISDRSFAKYLALRGLFAWTLAKFDRILAQTETDAARLRAIGAPEQSVETAGNVKFDQEVRPLSPSERESLRADLGIPNGAPTLVVGSTRAPDEEVAVLRAVKRARASLPDLALVHAPRHVDRAVELEQLMRSEGMRPVRRTQRVSGGEASELILDTFGELASVYAAGDVAYIGNSLLPPGGGQNLLQPLAHGKPVLYGPYMQNFRDLAAMAEAAGTGFRVQSEEELAARLVELLRDAKRRAEIAERAVQLIESNRGAAARCAETVARLLEERSARG